MNGVGKTTSIAKLASAFREDGRSVLLGAADTFRAAAIDQLQEWGRRLEIDVVAHRPGADPASVAFDTLSAARARGIDVVIIDTAGRLHTKSNLMEELKKMRRALSRQIGEESQRVLLTLDATTGQNGLYQARAFVDAVKCDGVFLAKLDGTAKGGIAIAIADELGSTGAVRGHGREPRRRCGVRPAGLRRRPVRGLTPSRYERKDAMRRGVSANTTVSDGSSR